MQQSSEERERLNLGQTSKKIEVGGHFYHVKSKHHKFMKYIYMYTYVWAKYFSGAWSKVH